jgi:hypothetical protein
MPSLYCSRCGLRTRLTPAALVIENCPRCMGHGGTISPLVVSPSATASRVEDASAGQRVTAPPTPS